MFLRAIANTQEACAAADGEVVIHRSVPQLIRGMGLRNGPTVRRTQQRYRNQVYRWVKYLAPLGITAEEAPRGPRGRGTGILIRIPAGVAQSVKAAFQGLRRSPPALLRPGSWDQVSAPPSGLATVGGSSAVCGNPSASAGARAGTVDAIQPAADFAPTASAALDRENGTSEGGGASAAAIRAWQRNTDAPWRLSRLARGRLERYSALLDAEADAGYTARWLEGQIEDAFEPFVGTGAVLGHKPWDRDGRPDGGRPRSLGYFVRLLRRQYRLVRKRNAEVRRRRAHGVLRLGERFPGAAADELDGAPVAEPVQVTLRGPEV